MKPTNVIELIRPYRKNRVCKPTQDGRKLRRYASGGASEQTIVWLRNFKWLVARNEVYAHLFLGFAKLA